MLELFVLSAVEVSLLVVFPLSLLEVLFWVVLLVEFEVLLVVLAVVDEEEDEEEEEDDDDEDELDEFVEVELLVVSFVSELCYSSCSFCYCMWS